MKINSKKAATPAVAPFGPAVLFVNVFDKERNEFVTSSFEGYETWTKAVNAGREALRDAVVAYQKDFRDQSWVEPGEDYDSAKQLLTLWVEDRPNEVIAEAMVLATPELPHVNW